MSSRKVLPTTAAVPVEGEDVTTDNSNDQKQQKLTTRIIEEEARVPSRKVTPLTSKKALWGWLILCFSTGPTSSMVSNYVAATIQSVANELGHVPGSSRPCQRRGKISCVVEFGGHEIDYLSYLLYLKSIGRALEGVVAISVAGLADYSSYRKTMLMISIYTFGALALPFAGLSGISYGYLTGLSVLYCSLTVVQAVYTVIEGSYIPLFIQSVGWQQPRQADLDDDSREPQNSRTRVDKVNTVYDEAWIRGSRASVLGLVSSNVGGLVALLIGVVITYARGSYVKEGYFNYLLAITIGGVLTIIFAILGHITLPEVHGEEKPKDGLQLFSSVTIYPEAFKLCLGWILWNTAYGNFLGLLGSLFLEVAGITSGNSIYTVYSFTSVIFACCGSLGWMFASPYIRVSIKFWPYLFLGINILCVFWGCLGISSTTKVGYKHVAEIWIAQVLFMSSSSALRSYNRALYSSFIPRGSEALYFGLEVTLDLATGWINPLVQAVIQNRTHNLRYPMLPNLFLILLALGLYLWVNVPKGIEAARKSFETESRVHEESE